MNGPQRYFMSYGECLVKTLSLVWSHCIAIKITLYIFSGIIIILKLKIYSTHSDIFRWTERFNLLFFIKNSRSNSIIKDQILYSNFNSMHLGMCGSLSCTKIIPTNCIHITTMCIVQIRNRISEIRTCRYQFGNFLIYF